MHSYVAGGLCCWSGERWTARRVVALLLGARVVAVRLEGPVIIGGE